MILTTTMKRLGVTKPRGAMMRNITSATLFHENAKNSRINMKTRKYRKAAKTKSQIEREN